MPGIRLKTAELNGLREIPITALAARSDELLAYDAVRPDWRLVLSAERLSSRVIADVFNLVTVGDGLVGGSASIRYVILNQGVQEFRVRVPSHWKNIEFTGPNIRRKEFRDNIWTISLQDKVWGGYTLVVTYDFQFDPHQATLPIGGIHALDVERETGSVAVTSAANLQLAVKTMQEPLRRIDEFELAETDRALITRPVLMAFRYEMPDYELALDVTRFAELPVLDAVADRTQLTTVLTDAGQMLTQASFMVKNNDKHFQRFTMPPGADFWSCYVAGQPVKPERDKGSLLVPLPCGSDRNQAFAVEIVYAQNVGSLKTVRPRTLPLVAPTTDLQTTYAEWELYVPQTHRLASFGGNMTVARGTTYGLRDAWDKFLSFYDYYFTEHVLGSLILCGAIVLVAGLIVILFVFRYRGTGWVFGLFVIVGIVAWIALLPALEQRRIMRNIGSGAGMSNPMLVPEYFRSEAPAPPSPAPVVSQPMRERTARVVDGGNVLVADGHVQFQRSTVTPMYRSGGEPTSVNGLGLSPATTNLTRVYGSAGTTEAVPSRETEVLKSSPTSQPAVVGKPTQLDAGIRPVVAGVRPIRIDLPRTGQRFVFTKVLNVQDEPLSVRAVAMELSVYNAVRGVLQALAFVLGVLIVWLSLRRKQPNSFVMTLGAALIVGSVAHLLISMRWLHLFFILAAPAVLVWLLVWVIRWFWHRSGPIHGHAATNGHPGTGESGLPPVAAAIALALFAATIAQASDVAGRTPSGGEDPPPSTAEGSVPAAVSVVSAHYNGAVRERVAEFDATIELAVARPDQVLPLFGPEVAVSQFSASPGNATLVREGGSVGVTLPRRGNTTLHIKFLVKLGGDVTKRQIRFAIPPALATRVSLVIDEPEAAVEFPTAVSFRTSTANVGADSVPQPSRGRSGEAPGAKASSVLNPAAANATRVEAVIGAGDRVEVLWTPRMKRAAETAATVFCQNASLVAIGGGVVNTRSKLDYQVTQGEVRQIRVALPAGQRLLRVDGDSIRTWDLKDESGGQVLSVELIKGVASANYTLTLVTEKRLDVLPAQTPVQVPRALDVKRETGFVAIGGSEEVSLVVESADELQRMDAAEFVKATGGDAGGAGVASAYRYQKPGFRLSVKVDAVQPQIEGVVHNRFLLGTERTSLEAHVDYTIKRAGVFALRLELPAEYTVTNVSGNQLSQWIEKRERDARVLEVTLKERAMGSYGLTVYLSRWERELSKAVEVVGVHPLGLQKVTGFVSVATEVGVQAQTGPFEGLMEIPSASLPDGASVAPGAGVLAFKFIPTENALEPKWKLTVATETIEPWVRAEVVNWLTLSDSLMNGRAVIRYEIANAPVKELRLRVPAAFKNVEINGANVRRRDQEGEEWRVQLQGKVIGTYLLTVTWEQPWSGKEAGLDLDGVGTLGVERETGALAVVAQPPLQAEKKTASGDLVPVDPRELPEWAGKASDATVLAFRYLRPGYKLAVTARRFAEAEVLQALVDNVHLTTVVADDGQTMTELSLSIRNNARQFLEVAIPKDARVWSAFVAGQAVRPTLRSGKLLLPLERGADGSPVSVEMTYVRTESFPKGNGRVSLVAPALDVPLKNARWDLYLPVDYRYGSFGGTMVHEVETSPILSAFTMSEYAKAEGEKVAAAKKDVMDALTVAKSRLAIGKVKEANESYSQLRDKYQAAYKTWIAPGDAEQLEKGIRRAQGSNVIASQQQLYDKNAVMAGTAIAAPARQPSSAQLDQEVAEQQWDKLQQAQEITVAKVQPLRVNLPTHGVRHSFNQVLQTEIGRSMTVQFNVASSRSIGWPMRSLMSVAAFAALWLMVHLTLERRKSTQR